jgi:hypothetical protein
MIKKDQYTYLGGMNVDMPPARRSKDQYFFLRNGRITSTYATGENNNVPSNGVIRCQSGNELKFTFTSIDTISANSGNLQVSYKIDNVLTTKTFAGVVNADIVALNAYLPVVNIDIVATASNGPTTYFLTTTTSPEHSIDCIWSYTEFDGLELIYINDLEWNSLAEENFDIVVNVESESVVKMYIADGEHQVFSVNLLSTTDLSKSKKVLYMVPQYNMSEPYLKQQIAGGQHTSGAIQYCYNLFNVNGGQTKISPTSELIFLGKANNGGDVNEIIGKSNIITIDNIDSNYDYMRIYSIKYNDLNTVPIVSVVGEFAAPKGATPNSGTITITDDGRVKYNITLEELVFLGGTEIIPRCIIAKKNRFLLANIQEDIWEINQGLTVDSSNYFDSRAYSADVAGNVKIKDKSGTEYTLLKTARAYTISGSNVSVTHDAIQNKNVPADGTLYQLHPATAVPGGEGRFVSYTIISESTTDIIAAGYDPDDIRYMKCGEVYRWAIEFYNDKSQKSTPQWIADVVVPAGFSNNGVNRATIQFVISSAGIARLQAQDIVGYKFLRVERQESDKSVIAQGIITPMIFQETSPAIAKVDANFVNGASYKNNNVKISCPWVRHYQDQIDIPYTSFFGGSPQYRYDVKINKLLTNSCINLQPKDSATHVAMAANDRNPTPWQEIYRDTQSSNSLAVVAGLQFSFQDNRIMQLFSPETVFGNPSLYSGMRLRAVASLKQNKRSAHGKMVHSDLNNIFREYSSESLGTLFNISKYTNSGSFTETHNFLNANGYIGPNKPDVAAPGVNTEQLLQYYREYLYQENWALKIDGTVNEKELLGSPEFSRNDSNIRTYNGNGDYRYTNSLQSILADGRTEYVYDGGSNTANWDKPIYGVDSVAAPNITFVLSNQDSYETLMLSLSNSATSATPTSDDNVLLAELVVDIENQYGGKYYEDRSINKYIGVGKYQTITAGDNTYQIMDCGDVFVGNFLFARISRIGGVSFSETRIQMSEIVSIPVETTINLKERSDNSFGGWKSTFLPTNDEFHKYNSVYSQLGNAIISQPDPFLLIKNVHFTNRILATKPKISGEIIDSWTDVLVNEELYLEGEYGRINRLFKFNDILYSFQRDGVSIVSVLPRVQIATNDSIAIELGVGQVLNTYQYINTNSGCDDFNGIVSTSSAVYYGDRIRRTINMIEGATVSGLSDTLGMSQYVKGYDTDKQYKPKFVLGFNPITDDVYFTITRQSDDNTGTTETLIYDEGIKRFTEVCDMPAKFVFTIDGKLYSISTANDNKVWNHFLANKSCNFYGTQYAMELTICLNPEGGQNDCVFNALEWTHDVVDTTNPTTHYNDNITALSCYNDYLTANAADVSTIQRRFRMSRIYIPRSSSDNVSRIRGHYLFAKISYTPNDPKKTILLNDLVLYYSAQRS